MKRPLLPFVLSAAMSAGCTGIPSTGPTAGAFVSEAAVSARGWTDAGFLLLPVDSRVLAYTAPEPRPSLRSVAGTAVPPERGIGVGDVLSITVFEATAGGLFTSGGVPGGGSPMTRLPDQAIGRDGNVTVPYAGRIPAAGLSKAALEARIVAALRDRAIEPQVIVSVTQSQGGSLSVTGDAVAGAAVPVPASGLRVLDAIALAGGPTAPVGEVEVALTRGDRTSAIPLGLLAATPSENVHVRGGDALLLTRRPRTFVALGATGQSAEVPLGGYDTNLAEALARVGGLGRGEANATGVFVMRRLPADFVRGLSPGHPLALSGAPVPVVYRFDLSEPQGLVHAQGFTVQDGDILYVSTAALANVRNALSVFQGIAAPAVSTTAAVNGL